MTNLNTTTTVGELASKLPHVTRVLEKYGIDYCCGGGTSLRDACHYKGVDVDEVLRAIEQDPRTNRPPAIDYSTLPLQTLVDHIVSTHHVFTRAELDRLTGLIEKVVSVHGVRHPELLQVQKVFADLKEDLLPHLDKEEVVLFPYIVRIETAAKRGLRVKRPPFAAAQNPIRMMLFEHDLAGELLRELRRITSNYTVPADGCASYRALYSALENFEMDLHQHIHLENNIVFPRAIDMEGRSASLA